MFQTVILNMNKHCTWATYFWWTESCQHQLKHLNILWVTVLQSLQIGQIFCRWRRLFDPASLGSHIKVLIQVADSCSSQRRWLPFLWASHHPGEKGNRRELTGLHLVEIDATQSLETHAAWYPPVISRKPVLEAQLQEWKVFRDFCLSALTHVHLEKKIYQNRHQSLKTAKKQTPLQLDLKSNPGGFKKLPVMILPSELLFLLQGSQPHLPLFASPSGSQWRDANACRDARRQILEDGS